MKFVLSILSVLTLLGCASTSYISQAKATRGDLRGMVYDLDRVPVVDAGVRIEGVGGATKTDVHGHFVVADVAFGSVTLVLEKPGYEPLRWTADYAEVSQVMYAQMADAPQLFDAAADALDQRDWTRAQTFLDRALVLDRDSPTGALLVALKWGRMGKPEDAVTHLEAYLAQHPRYVALEIAAADYCEQQLHQPDRALKHLMAAQALRYDPELDLRIRQLQGVSP